MIVYFLILRRQTDSLSSIENAVKYNPMYESDTTGYSHYYKRYPQLPSTSSTSPETSADFSSEEIRHIYENSELTKEVYCMAKTTLFWCFLCEQLVIMYISVKTKYWPA